MEHCPPYLYNKEGAWLCIEELWPEASALEILPESDLQQAAAFASPTRRREWLSWRALLHRELGPVEVGYNSVGAPRLLDHEGHIGVSHSRHSVGVAYSPLGPAALDIESSERNFAHILRRYLTPEEEQLASHAAWPCIAWCAKECLYKLGGRREIDLLRDISIERITPDHAIGQEWQQGEVVGRVDGKHFVLHFRRLGSEWVVWHLPE